VRPTKHEEASRSENPDLWHPHLPDDPPPSLFVQWKRVTLAPGESHTVTVAIDMRILQTFVGGIDGGNDFWNLAQGEYQVFVCPSSDNTPLTGSLQVR